MYIDRLKELFVMASSVKSGNVVNIRTRDVSDLKNILNVVVPSKSVRKSEEHLKRVKRAKRSFKDIAFKVK